MPLVESMTFNSFQEGLSEIESVPFSIVHVMETSAERIAYLRKGMQLTQAEFTDELNRVLKSQGHPAVTRGAVGNWERDGGTGLAMRNLQAISDMTGATIDWLANNKGPPPRLDLLRKMGEQLLGVTSPSEREFPFSVPVVAQAAGSTLGNGATILFDQDPLGWVQWLPGLAGLEGVYALEVTGDSMLPMFKPGKPVYVSPHTPAHKDDPVIIIEHRSSNGLAVGFIKVLVADRPDRIVARQLNPPLEIEFLKANGVTVHRVLEIHDLTNTNYTSIQVTREVPIVRTARRGPKR
jgi:phage repressor protein C with HTH and peptisase S24 domain